MIDFSFLEDVSAILGKNTTVKNFMGTRHEFTALRIPGLVEFQLFQCGIGRYILRFLGER